MPRPTQVRALAKLSIRAPLAPPAIPTPSPLLSLYEVFAPPFVLPRPIQVRTLGRLTLRAGVAPPAIPTASPMLAMYEVFAPPFAMPRPIQVRALAKLSLRAPLAPPAIPTPTPFLALYELFAPPFSMPRPTQVRALGKLTLRHGYPLASPLSLLLLCPEAFGPAFALPRPTQLPWVLGTLTKPQPAQSAPAWKAPSPLLTGAFAFVRPFELPRASQNSAVVSLARVADVTAGAWEMIPPWKKHRRQATDTTRI